MLYDKRWDAKVETKADPFSLENLIAWLEKQPARSTYDGCNSDVCLLAQWLQTKDPSAANVPGQKKHSYWYAVNGQEIDLQRFSNIAVASPMTFGAALKRARDALLHRST